MNIVGTFILHSIFVFGKYIYLYLDTQTNVHKTCEQQNMYTSLKSQQRFKLWEFVF